MTSFKATGLGPEILSAVADLGYKAPTPIQEKAIPILLKSNSDLIALAQTGTGKTAAFGLPMLQRLDPNRKVIQALILCPTRELALQIVNDLASYSKNIAKLKVVAIYGGASAERQIQQLRQGAQVVVGTPGRTKDLIERKELDIRDIEWLVLDEADEMLDRGFKHDLDAILSSTPKDKRTLLFSATMPEHISEIARTYLYKPKQVSVARLNSGAENVSHRYYLVPPRERYRYLRQLLREMGDMYGIVFCRTKRKTREVARRLRRDGFSAGALEGDMPQNKRDR
ncbi:MAG TPA: DEAD/DEAH box helicase, partial [Bacteroidetes bacterium]|nr:DEAD/DEAH box helicase [Bacteroidota bacterium]